MGVLGVLIDEVRLDPLVPLLGLDVSPPPLLLEFVLRVGAESVKRIDPEREMG